MKRYIRAATYNGMEFNDKQMRQIQRGLDEGLDVSWYADPKFSSLQMSYILNGLRTGLDVSQYADPQYTPQQMGNIIKELEGKYRFNPTSTKVIQKIAKGLNVDTNTAKFIAKLNAEDIGDTDCNSEEECIDYIIGSTPDRFKEILFNEGYDGLVEWYGDDFANQFLDAAKALGIYIDDYED